jgi:hypothetical protein
MFIDNQKERIHQDRHFIFAMGHLKNKDWTLQETVIYLREQYAIAFQKYNATK